MVSAATAAGVQRLHLDAGAIDGVDVGLDRDEVVADLEVDVDRADEQRVAQRDHVARALGGLDRRRPGPRRARRPSSPRGWRSPTVVSGCMNTLQRATARRCVGSFGVTSTMRARPERVEVGEREVTHLAPSVLAGLRRPAVAGRHGGAGSVSWSGPGRCRRPRTRCRGCAFSWLEVVVVPAGRRCALEEPVAAVVGDDEAVALHRLGDHPRLAGQPADVEARPSAAAACPSAAASGRSLRRGEVGGRQDEAALGLRERDPDRVADLARGDLVVAHQAGQDRQARRRRRSSSRAAAARRSSGRTARPSRPPSRRRAPGRRTARTARTCPAAARARGGRRRSPRHPRPARRAGSGTARDRSRRRRRRSVIGTSGWPAGTTTNGMP